VEGLIAEDYLPRKSAQDKRCFFYKKNHSSETFFENDSKKVFSSFRIATFFKNGNCMMSKNKF
jgi:hypothetical protein